MIWPFETCTFMYFTYSWWKGRRVYNCWVHSIKWMRSSRRHFRWGLLESWLRFAWSEPCKKKLLPDKWRPSIGGRGWMHFARIMDNVKTSLSSFLWNVTMLFSSLSQYILFGCLSSRQVKRDSWIRSAPKAHNWVQAIKNGQRQSNRPCEAVIYPMFWLLG